MRDAAWDESMAETTVNMLRHGRLSKCEERLLCTGHIRATEVVG
jgi:hypothetical protein